MHKYDFNKNLIASICLNLIIPHSFKNVIRVVYKASTDVAK